MQTRPQPGAKNIPLTQLRRKLKNLEKDFAYVVSSDGSGRGQLGCYLLTKAGFEAYVLDQPGLDRKRAGDAEPEPAPYTED